MYYFLFYRLASSSFSLVLRNYAFRFSPRHYLLLPPFIPLLAFIVLPLLHSASYDILLHALPFEVSQHKLPSWVILVYFLFSSPFIFPLPWCWWNQHISLEVPFDVVILCQVLDLHDTHPNSLNPWIYFILLLSLTYLLNFPPCLDNGRESIGMTPIAKRGPAGVVHICIIISRTSSLDFMTSCWNPFRNISSMLRE